MPVRVETRGRSRALQALYAWDIREDKGPLEQIASNVWDDLAVISRERVFATDLVRIIAADLSAIDSELAEVTTNWRLERLGNIERCVLRLATAELIQGLTPPRVVIQEAVWLAERFGSERSARFVNGVLDAVARRMGRLS